MIWYYIVVVTSSNSSLTLIQVGERKVKAGPDSASSAFSPIATNLSLTALSRRLRQASLADVH